MKNIIYKAVAITTLLGSFIVAWFLIDYNQFLSAPMAIGSDGYTYEIKQGETLKQLSKNLNLAGLIDQPRYLVIYGRLKGIADKIQTGEYLFESGLTPSALLEQITSGRTIQYSATIIEGLNFREMLAELKKNTDLVHTLTTKNPKEIMKQLGYDGQHAEGRFLPDTYFFTKGTTDVEFLRRAYEALEMFLASEWERRQPDLPYKNEYEALIMASIVEKETGLASERPEIAGVFVRRLQKRMRLQTDPTVIYGIGEKFDGNLRRRDLQRDTPYNTYRRRGLPPTPIAMAGKDAIRAALNPKDGDTLYFVSRGDGSHEFTSNLDDHNRAVIKYQLGGKPKPFSSMPKASK